MAEEKQNKNTTTKAGVRLVKRVILGKNKPPVIIRALAWFTMVWSFILAILSALLAVYALIHEDRMNKIEGINGLGFNCCL